VIGERIRPATPADVIAIERVVRTAYAKYVDRIGKPPGPMLDDYAARVAEGGVRVLEDARGLAGILVLLPQAGHLLLDNIAVAPERQGEGIGRRLLSAAEGEALQRGFDELRLYTNAAMQENLVMYARLGWEDYGRAEQAGYQRVFFRKRLAGRADASALPGAHPRSRR
jgi:GNAT superfamily N-acetyltransferase